MSLQGLPDFHQPIREQGCVIYWPYEGVGSYTLLPDSLKVAELANGQVDFGLHLLRSSNPIERPYGLLNFSVSAHYEMDKAFGHIRQYSPQATLTPCFFTGGWLRLCPVKAVRKDIPKELLQPMPLAWNGLGVARYSFKVSQDGATILQSALEDEMLTFHALAELEIEGVSPRLPIQVRFDPAKLWQALDRISDVQGRLVWNDVVKYLQSESAKGVFDITGNDEKIDPVELAEAITDRIRMRFGRPAFAEKIDSGSCFAFTENCPNEGHYLWELNKPHLALRPVTLYLHPLEAAKELVKKKGIESVITKKEVPELNIGIHSITVSANIPHRPQGVPVFGVTIEAPATKYRPQSQLKTIELSPPDYTDDISLRLSPMERLEYQYSTYVLWQCGDSLQQIKAQSKHAALDQLILAPSDFPLVFISIELASPLARLVSSVQGVLQWEMKSDTTKHSFELNVNQSSITLVHPREAVEATLTFICASMDGGRTCQVGPYSARNFTLGLYCFPEFGTHTIEIKCQLQDETDWYAVELLPENGMQSSVLHFTPEQVSREWSWYAESPFSPGYRYRKHRPEGLEEPWSDVQAYDRPLQINARKSEQQKIVLDPNLG